MTGYAGGGDQQKSMEAGFDRHVAKPPDPEELGRVIADCPGRGAGGDTEWEVEGK